MNEEERGRICIPGNPMLSRLNGCPAYLLVFMQLVSSFQCRIIYIAEYAYVQLGGLEYNFRLSGTSCQLRRSANIQQMTLGDYSFTSQMKRGYVVKFVGFCQHLFFNTNVIQFVKYVNPRTGTLCCQTPSDIYPNVEIKKSGYVLLAGTNCDI